MRKSELERAIVDMLAKGLTPNQRAALLWLPADGAERTEDSTRHLRLGLWGLCRKKVVDGVSADLATLRSEAKMAAGKWLPDHWRATPLGLKVRTVLAAELAPAEGGGNG